MQYRINKLFTNTEHNRAFDSKLLATTQRLINSPPTSTTKIYATSYLNTLLLIRDYGGKKKLVSSLPS